MERIRFLQREHEGFEQADRAFDVIEMCGLHDGMHAAQRERDEGGGDAFAGVENLVGVGAGETARRFVLEVDLFLFRKCDEPFDDEWVVAGAVGDGRAAAELHQAELRGLYAGGVGGVGDIEAKADIGLESVGGHHRAVAADLFLDRVETDEGDGGFLAGFGDALHHLRDDVGAEAVVQGAADQAFVGEFRRAVDIHHWMPDTETEGGDFFRVGRADIDPEIVHGGRFLTTEFVAAEVDRGVTDDAGDFALVAEDAHTAAAAGGGVRTADAVDAEEAFVVDVLDDVTDLIGVSLQHHDLLRFSGKGRPGGAIGIAFHGSGEGLHVFRPDTLAGHFEAGGGGGFEEVEKEFFIGFFHGAFVVS